MTADDTRDPAAPPSTGGLASPPTGESSVLADGGALENDGTGIVPPDGVDDDTATGLGDDDPLSPRGGRRPDETSPGRAHDTGDGAASP